MAELKGLEGYIAALKDPENWEVDTNTIAGPNSSEWSICWRGWSSDLCSSSDLKWRRKPLRYEANAHVTSKENVDIHLFLPPGFSGKRVRITVEEIEP